jgi:glutathione peroxidase
MSSLQGERSSLEGLNQPSKIPQETIIDITTITTQPSTVQAKELPGSDLTWSDLKQGLATGEINPVHKLPSSSPQSGEMLHNSAIPPAPPVNTLSTLLAPAALHSIPCSEFHALSARDAEGKVINFVDFVGKPIVIVNVALESALASQFLTLQRLYDKYHKLGFEILAFPCNQFGGGAPGTALEIKNHVARSYGVTFPIMEIVDVEGDNTHPVFKFLKAQKKNMLVSGVKWNFEKWLLDNQGHVVDRWNSLASADLIEPHLVRLLNLPHQL